MGAVWSQTKETVGAVVSAISTDKGRKENLVRLRARTLSLSAPIACCRRASAPTRDSRDDSTARTLHVRLTHHRHSHLRRANGSR